MKGNYYQITNKKFIVTNDCILLSTKRKVKICKLYETINCAFFRINSRGFRKHTNKITKKPVRS